MFSFFYSFKRNLVTILTVLVTVILLSAFSAQAEDLIIDENSDYPPYETLVYNMQFITPRSSYVNNNVYAVGNTAYIVVGGLYHSLENGAVGNVSGNLVIVGGKDEQVIAFGAFGGFGGVGLKSLQQGVESVFAQGDLTVSHNKVIVTNAFIGSLKKDWTGDVYGGEAVYHGYGTSAVNDNLAMVDGVRADYIMGGRISYLGSNLDQYDLRVAQARNNQVYVSNTIVDQMIIGGYIDKAAYATMTDNTVTVSGDVQTGSIFGGFLTSVSLDKVKSYDEFSGNILNVITPGEGGIKVEFSVGNFEIYRFVFDLNNPNANVGLTMGANLWLSSGFRDESADKQTARIESIDFLAGQIPEVGYQAVLFQAEYFDDGNFEQTSADGLSGVNLALNYALSIEGPPEGQVIALGNGPKYKMIANLKGLKAHPQMESPSQGWTAGLAFVTQGLEPIANRLTQTPLAGSAPRFDACPGVFFDASAGRSSYGSSGNFDLNTLNGVVGVNCVGNFASGDLTMGGFVDFGQGDFSTEAILNGRQVKGEGTLKRIGGGVMAQFEFGQKAQKTVSVESSLRFGHLRQDYSSQDFENSQFDARFDTSSLYVGGHVGVNAKFGLSETSRLDLYGRYAHLWLQGDQAMVDGTAPVDFKNSTSQVGRLGARVHKNVTPKLSFKIGLGYEHEFNGVTKSDTAGYKINDVNVKGGTGVAEVGLSYKSAGPKPIALSLTAEGFTGKRKGLSASLNFSVAF